MWEWNVNGLVYLFLMYFIFCEKCQIVFIVFYFIDTKPVEVWRTLENLGMTTMYGELNISKHTNEGQHTG